jgi:hypothetical protein
LAIDDLSTRTGVCSATITPPNTYKCLDGTLIPITKVSSSIDLFKIVKEVMMNAHVVTVHSKDHLILNVVGMMLVKVQ